MRNIPSHSLWKHKMLIAASIAVMGAAAHFAHAAPLYRDTHISQPHASIVHLWINGHAVPAAAQNRVIHIPGGVIRVQTISWSAGGPGNNAQVSRESLSSARAQSMVQQSLMQLQTMQVSMDRQIAQMQRLMRVSFGPFMMPAYRLPVPVTLLTWSSQGLFSGTAPQQALNATVSSGATPPIPVTPLQAQQQTLQVRWEHLHTASSPKTQI